MVPLDIGKHSPAVWRLGKERRLKRPPLGSSVKSAGSTGISSAVRHKCQLSQTILGLGKSTEDREWAVTLL